MENEETNTEGGGAADTSFKASFDKAFEEGGYSEEPAEPTEPTQGAEPTAAEQTVSEPKTGQASDGAQAQKKGAATAAKGAGAATSTSLQPRHQWPDDVKAQFAKLPAELQKFLLDRHSEVDRSLHGKTQELAEQRARFSEFEEIEEQYQDEMARRGLTMPQLTSRLMQLHEFSARNPVGFIQWFAQENGIALQQLLQEQQQPNQIPPGLQELYQGYQELRTWKEQFETQQQESELTDRTNAIASWAGEIGANGQPLRPHFQAVYQVMEPLVTRIRQAKPQASLSEILSEAYEQAIWASPEIRQQLLLTQRVHQAKAADKAAVNISSNAGSAPVRAAPKGLREAFDRAYQEMGRE